MLAKSLRLIFSEPVIRSFYLSQVTLFTVNNSKLNSFRRQSGFDLSDNCKYLWLLLEQVHDWTVCKHFPGEIEFFENDLCSKFVASYLCTKLVRLGVNVMITIFAIFTNFRRTNGVFLKNQCYDRFSA
jgi:hypothetical protein